MHAELEPLLAVALPAIVGGLIALALMVQRELGPFARLEAGGRWLLTGALGMGVFAFTLKMAVAITLSELPPEAMRGSAPARSTVEEAGDFINPGPARTSHYVWQSLPERAPAPPDNPTTSARVALGRELFNEKRLSGDGTLACASCHALYEHGGADGRPTAQGIAGQVGARNTPSVWNAAFQARLFWDGRAASLEEQAQGPILNPIEMGLPSAAEAERLLNADAHYRAAFARAFGDDGAITFPRVAQAIAAYERTLITADTPYDRFVRGDGAALDAAQKRGMALFESLGCINCHRGANFSDASLLGGENPWRLFPANRTAYDARYRLLQPDGQPGTWRVASLRNVALTGPWLHNGSVDRLEEVVRIMAAAQLGRSGQLLAWLDTGQALAKVDRTPPSDAEVADLVAFLKALSSDRLVAAQRQ